MKMLTFLAVVAAAVCSAGRAAHAGGIESINADTVYSRETTTVYLTNNALNISQGYVVTLASGEAVYKLEVAVVGATVNGDTGTCFNDSGYLLIAMSSSVTGGGMTSVGGANGEYNHLQFHKFGSANRDADRAGYGPYVDYLPRTATFTIYIGKPNRTVYLPAVDSAGCPGNGNVFRITVWKGRRVAVPTTTS